MPWWGWIGVLGFLCTLTLMLLVILAWAAKRGDELRARYQAEWDAEARALPLVRRRTQRENCSQFRSHVILVGDLRMPERRVSR